MTNINYQKYFFEAAKITFFCLVVTGLFALFASSKNTLLIVFNMAVMTAAATFSVEQKHFHHAALGSLVMIISIVAGGILGFYYPFTAKLLTILYAGLAFYLPKKNYQLNIFVTSAVMFLIFSSLPFDFQHGMRYLFDGLIVCFVFIIFYFLFDYKKQTNQNEIINRDQINRDQIKNNHITAMIAVFALIVGFVVSYFLSLHYHLSHLYWIGLTILVIVQGSQQKTIQTAMKRILVNAAGAIIIVLLFNYVMPSAFWINFLLLVLFLFLIFFFSFSYVGRILFIELFVLGFTHLLGDYQNAIAFDRVLLTLIGGMIVIVTTALIYFLERRRRLG